jgi:hypothetical protein
MVAKVKFLLILLVLGMISPVFAGDCTDTGGAMTEDCTQVANIDITGDLSTEGFVWDTATYDLTVSGDVIINGTNGKLDAGDGGTISFGSLKVSTATNIYNATTSNTTITSDDGTYTFQSGGIFYHNSGTLVINSPNNGKLIRVSADFGDFILDNGGVTLIYRNELDDITGDLTLVSGSLQAYGSKNIVVIGDVLINSGCVLNTSTSIGATADFGSLTIESGGTYDATSGTTTLTNKNALSIRINIDGGTFTHNDGELKFDSDGYIAANWGYLDNTEFYDITIDSTDSPYIAIRDSFKVINEFKVDHDAEFYAYNNGDIIVTLGNASQSGTISGIGNLRMFELDKNDVAFYGYDASNVGIINNTGITNWETGGAGTVRFKWIDWQNNITTKGTGNTYQIDGDSEFDNFIVISGDTLNITSDANANFLGDLVYDGNLTLDGNITNVSYINVTENVVLNGLLNASQASSVNVGSLTINNGGTYEATNGTTTITDNDGTYSVNFVGTGVLIHNDGTFNITTPKSTYLGNSGAESYYNLIMAMGDISRNIRLGGGDCLVANDFTATSGDMFLESSRDFIVTGDTVIESGSKITGNAYPIYFGSLTINSGGEYSATSGTTTVTGISSQSYCINLDGEVSRMKHNDGTVVIDVASGYASVFNIGTSTATDGVYNVIINSMGATSSDINYARATTIYNNFISNSTTQYNLAYTNRDLIIGGNLTLEGSGTIVLMAGADLTVGGDVVINAGQLGTSVYNGEADFGSLTINNGGTYEATSGTTTVSGDFDNNGGTFTHNDGEVLFDTIDSDINLVGARTPITFYNLTTNVGGDDFFVYSNITVINSLTIPAARFAMRLAGLYLFLGNDSIAGEVVNNYGSDRGFSVQDKDNTHIVGLNPTQYAVIRGAYQPNFDERSGYTSFFDNLDFQKDITTGGNSNIVILDGDCEFDAFTVSSGDTFDLNGQRVEFGGELSYLGTLKANDSMIVLTATSGTSIDKYNSGTIGTDEFNNDTVLVADYGLGNTVISYIDSQVGILFAQSGVFEATAWSPIFIKTIIGSEVDTVSRPVFTSNDIIIANGGIFNGRANTISILGDWTSSGGLIGKSAFECDGANVMTVPDDAALDITEDISFEAWIKTSTSQDDRYIIRKGNGVYQVEIELNVIKFQIYVDGANSPIYSTTELNDGKWHHVAATWDGTTQKLYTDGKLEASTALSGTLGTDGGALGMGATNAGVNAFTGQIGMIRIFNDSRTQSEIRADMFNPFADMDDTGNLVAMYQFDEGTSTTVDNVEGTAGLDATMSAASWASGGTFTEGTSTVNFIGNGTIAFLTGQDFYNLGVAAATKTTTLWAPVNDQQLDILGTLTTGSGTFTDDTQSQKVNIRGSASPVDGGSTFVNISRIYYTAGTADITGSTYGLLYSTSYGRNLLGDVTATLLTTSVNPVTSNGHNLTLDGATINSGLTLSAGSTLTFTSATGFGASTGILSVTDSTITSDIANPYDFDASMTMTLDNSTIENFASPFKVASGKTLTTENSVTIGGNYTLEGIHTAGSSTITITDDWNDTLGTFDDGTSTIVFSGSEQNIYHSSGDIRVAGGTLSTADFEVGDGATFEIFGTTWTNTSAPTFTGSGVLNEKYTLTANTTNSAGIAVDGANVTIIDTDNSALTNASGLAQFNLTGTVYNASGITTTTYSFNASKCDGTCIVYLQEAVQLTADIQYDVTLGYVPTVPSLASPANDVTYEGLNTVTLQFSSTDIEDDTITYSVYLSNTSSFDANSTTLIYNGTDASFEYEPTSYDTYYWKVNAKGSENIASSLASEIYFTVTADATNPSIVTITITTGLTSGETATARANVTDVSPVTSWVSVNDSSGTQTNYSMSQEGSTDFFNATFEVGAIGTYYYKVYANDSYTNLNDSVDWQEFNVLIPNASSSEVAPTNVLPSTIVRLTSNFTNIDLVNDVFGYLNLPSGFTLFDTSSYPQNQSFNNISADETALSEWRFFAPNADQIYSLNVTWYDLYGNTWQSDNSNIIVTYDPANVSEQVENNTEAISDLNETVIELNDTVSDLNDTVTNNTEQIENITEQITNVSNLEEAIFVNVAPNVEIDAGNNFNVEIYVRDAYGNYTNVTSIEVSLIDPMGEVSVGPTTAGVGNISTGRYNYTKKTASGWTAGEWQIFVSVVVNDKTYTDYDYFKITSGPFDVRDIEITDTTSPSLTASVVLENLGNAVTDIVLDWNLTRTDTGEILDSGQDTVGVAGGSTSTHSFIMSSTYTGAAQLQILGYYGVGFTERAGAIETFTILQEDEESPEETGYASGGGGVTSAATTTPSYAEEVLKEESSSTLSIINLVKVDSETITEQDIGDVQRFTIDEVNIHKITILSIGKDAKGPYVEVEIASKPKIVKLYLDEVTEVDVDDDGVMDITLTLNDIADEFVDITIENVIDKEAAIEEITVSKVSTVSMSPLVLVAALVLVMASMAYVGKDKARIYLSERDRSRRYKPMKLVTKKEHNIEVPWKAVTFVLMILFIMFVVSQIGPASINVEETVSTTSWFDASLFNVMVFIGFIVLMVIVLFKSLDLRGEIRFGREHVKVRSEVLQPIIQRPVVIHPPKKHKEVHVSAKDDAKVKAEFKRCLDHVKESTRERIETRVSKQKMVVHKPVKRIIKAPIQKINDQYKVQRILESYGFKVKDPNQKS